MDSLRKYLAALAIAWITLGLFCAYMFQRDLPEGVWDKYYYIWDKAKDLLIVLALALHIDKVYKRYLLALSVFLLIRLLWEALAIQNWKLANSWEIIDLLFLMDALIVIFIFGHDLTKSRIKWRENS